MKASKKSIVISCMTLTALFSAVPPMVNAASGVYAQGGDYIYGTTSIYDSCSTNLLPSASCGTSGLQYATYTSAALSTGSITVMATSGDSIRATADGTMYDTLNFIGNNIPYDARATFAVTATGTITGTGTSTENLAYLDFVLSNMGTPFMNTRTADTANIGSSCLSTGFSSDITECVYSDTAGTLSVSYDFPLHDVPSAGLSFGAFLHCQSHNGSCSYVDPFTITLPQGVTFTSASGQFLTAPVPVPAAAWLFGSGLLGLAGVARRKRASANKATAS